MRPERSVLVTTGLRCFSRARRILCPLLARFAVGKSVKSRVQAGTRGNF
jgi:hypothetical protein